MHRRVKTLNMENTKEILLKSFDTELTPEEQKLLDNALQRSEELRKEKQEIEQMRNLLSGQEASFKSGFEDRVMDRLETQPTASPKAIEMVSIFKRVAITGMAAIIALLITIYFVDGTLNLDSLFGLTNYSPDGAELSMLNLQDYEQIILP